MRHLAQAGAVRTTLVCLSFQSYIAFASSFTQPSNYATFATDTVFNQRPRLVEGPPSSLVTYPTKSTLLISLSLLLLIASRVHRGERLGTAAATAHGTTECRVHPSTLPKAYILVSVSPDSRSTFLLPFLSTCEKPCPGSAHHAIHLSTSSTTIRFSKYFLSIDRISSRKMNMIISCGIYGVANAGGTSWRKFAEGGDTSY